ncbi:MAG: glycoside hydrolase family 16 protein [Acidothermaceae bacterium]
MPDASLFSFQTGGNGWGNKEVETYTDRPQNASLDGHGDLVLTMRQENFTGSDGIRRHYTSARLTTLGHWSFDTGTLSARIKLPSGAGLWPAFWLVGTNIDTVGWPACGEIDVVETVNSGDTEYTSVHGPDSAGKFWTISSHRPASGFPGGQTEGGAHGVAKASFGGGFHVYSVTRSPGSITARIDGTVIGHLTKSELKPGQRWVFDAPMAALLNVAVGGFWPGAPTSETPASASMVVDWLRYQP